MSVKNFLNISHIVKTYQNKVEECFNQIKNQEYMPYSFIIFLQKSVQYSKFYGIYLKKICLV